MNLLDCHLQDLLSSCLYSLGTLLQNVSFDGRHYMSCPTPDNLSFLDGFWICNGVLPDLFFPIASLSALRCVSASSCMSCIDCMYLLFVYFLDFARQALTLHIDVHVLSVRLGSRRSQVGNVSLCMALYLCGICISFGSGHKETFQSLSSTSSTKPFLCTRELCTQLWHCPLVEKKSGYLTRATLEICCSGICLEQL